MAQSLHVLCMMPLNFTMIRLTMMTILRCVTSYLFVVVIIGASSPINTAFADATYMLRRGRDEGREGIMDINRSLQEAVPAAFTTTRCNAIRTDNYEAELRLSYEYEVEFKHGSSRSLEGIERAIIHAIAKELDACDALDRPVYKVKATARHTFSKTGNVVPVFTLSSIGFFSAQFH